MTAGRRKKTLWQVLTDSRAPAQEAHQMPAQPPSQYAPKKPQLPPQPAPALRAEAGAQEAEAWAVKALTLMVGATDGETFQVAASAVYTMIHYEPENGYAMAPYLPNLIMSLLVIGNAIGTASPECREKIGWCVGEVLDLATESYNPPDSRALQAIDDVIKCVAAVEAYAF